jgi:hypothetical protein
MGDEKSKHWKRECGVGYVLTMSTADLRFRRVRIQINVCYIEYVAFGSAAEH